MPGTTSTALPSFSHNQHYKTDAAQRKGGGGLSAVIGSILLPCSQLRIS